MNCEECGEWSGDRKFCSYTCSQGWHRKRYREKLQMARDVVEDRKRTRQQLIKDGYMV